MYDKSEVNAKDLDKKLAGIKQTRQRKMVIELLKQASQPMSALRIQEEAQKQGLQIWLSTIYRILDLLTEKDIAIKSTVIGQDQAVYGINRYEHKHYAVCVSCHKIIPMDNCPMSGDDFNPGLREKNFRIIGHKIEIYGYCDECSRK